jgi:hypothetical protein
MIKLLNQEQIQLLELTLQYLVDPMLPLPQKLQSLNVGEWEMLVALSQMLDEERQQAIIH